LLAGGLATICVLGTVQAIGSIWLLWVGPVWLLLVQTWAVGSLAYLFLDTVICAVYRMDKPRRRRRFQFSLRTLLLAISVSAVVLSGVLTVGPCLSVLIGVYLLWLLRVRIKRGYERGVRTAAFNTAIAMGCLGLVMAFLTPMHVLWIPALYLIGVLAGFFGFLLVHAGVWLWRGKRLDTKQETAEQSGPFD